MSAPATASAHLFHAAQKRQKDDPRQHGQAVEIAVEAFVLAHDVARRFDDAAQLLHGGGGLIGFLLVIDESRRGLFQGDHHSLSMA